MGEITLKSGKVVPVDVSELTVAEWRKFTSPLGTASDENAVVVKCTNLSIADIEGMNFQEYRRVIKAILKQASEPITDPS